MKQLQQANQATTTRFWPRHMLLLTAVPLLAAHALADDVVVYGQSSWKYQVVAWGAGAAAFGNLAGCTPPSTVRTTWPSNTDLVARLRVQLPCGTGSVQVGVAIDNDISVWCNGVDVSGGVRTSGGCAVRDRYVFNVPDSALVAGENVIAVRAHDYGSVTFFDARVAANFQNVLRVTQQPASGTICIADSRTFSIVAAGGGTLAYRWQIEEPSAPGGWADIANGDNSLPGDRSFSASGAATPQLTITRASGQDVIQLGHTARVRCAVTNACGSLNSNPATLTLCACLACPADFNQDGGVDGVDVQAFFASWEVGNCDADVNLDGGVDGSDVNSFFAVWEDGRC